eukprot:CAMPEP_0183740094 /NCGR_PEP_ID=MMETSP0737-20130205/58773_1 /TAXON_ID=385413 /ORGANISM="Thalassiosira miniscula, Strain CCMP1093" /LENGTH=793 /DNA_ID=CAMNT_0025975079 /DNA_START=256 /DNA_END=2637 /DNA_ORIENTATION=+
MRTSFLLHLILTSVSVRDSTQVTHDSTNHLTSESICSDPVVDCGFGLWNEHSCVCDCIPPYCFSDIHQSCAAPGSCPDPFEGCTTNVDCPYFPNPSTGQCESGPKISQGVYLVFRTVEECCEATYTDPSNCIPVTSTVSNSLETSVTTAAQATLPQALSQTQTTATPQAETSPAETSPAETIGVSLMPISISLHNLSPQFQLNDIRRGEMIDVIQEKLIVTSGNLNETILHIDIFDDLSKNQDLWDKYTGEIQISVTGTSVSLTEIQIQTAFLNSLQGQIYEIAGELKDAWGSEIYTDIVILSIDDAQTSLEPTPRPTIAGDIAIPSNPNNDDGGKNNTQVWAVILASILFVMICCGLLVWQRQRDKKTDRQLSDHSSYFDESSHSSSSKRTNDLSPSVEQSLPSRSPGSIHTSQSFNRSQKSIQRSNQLQNKDPSANQLQLMNQSFNQSRRSRMDATEIFNQSRQTNLSSDPSRESRIDPSSTQLQLMNHSFSQSRPSSQMNQNFQSHRTDQRSINLNRSNRIDRTLNQSRRINKGKETMKRVQIEPIEENYDMDQMRQADQLRQKPYQHIQQNDPISAEEENLEEGYDGGKSSFLMSNTNVADDESSDEGLDVDESDDNVLGLLYYDGASSADEESAKESRKTRRSGRSGRTNRSGKSSGKSAKTKSSRPKKKKRSKRIVETAHHQQRQLNSYADMVGESEEQNFYVTQPKTSSDQLSGSMVYINTASSQHGMLDANKFITEKNSNARGEQSIFSHGSTIRSDDSHRKEFTHNQWAKQYCESPPDYQSNMK